MDDYEDKGSEARAFEGRGGNLGAAFESAWETAKSNGAPPGLYTVEIAIEARNPIHSYIVILAPAG